MIFCSKRRFDLRRLPERRAFLVGGRLTTDLVCHMARLPQRAPPG